eukprot:NODE_3018_length_2106_cov_5.522991.p1 GENE.NODE_3018_length_2106_cov_5.522991~~NODE_3018_length_2106_cov_5.522991.p1  ORF type:complete len:514 (+),score=109.94 NODE_3018_length_2106_cov_5.522991:85-1542(+)
MTQWGTAANRGIALVTGAERHSILSESPQMVSVVVEEHGKIISERDAIVANTCTMDDHANKVNRRLNDAIAVNMTGFPHEALGFSAALEMEKRLLSGLLSKRTRGRHRRISSEDVTDQVTSNGDTDWDTLLFALAINSIIITGCLIATCILRSSYPVLFYNGTSPFVPSASPFGWLFASCRVSVAQIAATAGLDAAMLIEFFHLCLVMLLWIGLPTVAVLGTAHCVINHEIESNNTAIFMLDVPDISDDSSYDWLWYLHAFWVWLVVFIVQRQIFSTQDRFKDLRLNWLEAMPAPRARTVLVTHLPRDKRSDDALVRYFNGVFGRDVVECAHIVKRTCGLRKLATAYDESKCCEEAAEFLTVKAENARLARQRGEYDGIHPRCCCWYRSPALDAPTAPELQRLRHEVKSALEDVKMEREWIFKETARGVDSNVSTHAGFVTFKTRRDSGMALRLNCTTDDEVFRIAVPPAPSDVFYENLTACTFS